MPSSEAPATLIAPLFDAGCVTEEAVPALVDDQLHADERAYLVRAVPKRRAEFGTARLCARRALARLGVAAGSLVPLEDRAPRWPEAAVGSITHTHGYCGVVVAHAARFRSLGLDVERDKALAPDMVAMICTPRERQLLGARSERDAIVYFAAKEAFYKCQYPLTRQFLDFQDVELEVDFTAATFRARVLKTLATRPEWLDELPGKFDRRQNLVLCGVALT